MMAESSYRPLEERLLAGTNRLEDHWVQIEAVGRADCHPKVCPPSFQAQPWLMGIKQTSASLPGNLHWRYG